MSRKLVTIRRVSEVNPIPEADSIERITIEGWNVVSQKGNYQPGDFAVYFEIDSFLPDGDQRWQDLVDKAGREFEGKRGHRLRTIKLRGQVSQGFSIPLRKFPEINELLFKEHGSEMLQMLADGEFRDRDFSELLGVVKWEQPLPAELAGLAKGLFPSFIQKTDQERVQNLPNVLQDKEARYEVSTKLDGSSMTVYHFNGEVGVCSRNLEMKLDPANASNTLIKLATDTNLLEQLPLLDRNIAIQGELMGPGIQGNREQLKQHEYHVFDIFDIDAGQYLAPEERRELFNVISEACGAGNLFKHVPVLDVDFNLDEAGLKSIEDILNFAEGPSIKHQIREGLVFKRKDGKFSFKAISNKFLLKEKD